MTPPTYANQSGDIDIQTPMRTITDHVAAMFAELREDSILKTTKAKDISSLAKIGTPGAAHAVDEVINEALAVFDYRMRMNHPRFLSFIPSPASPYSMMGETLTSAFNTFAGCKLEGSGPGAIEDALLKWLSSRVGLPDTAGGVFVSGGSVANLTAMVLARDRIIPQGKQSLGVAYVSDQTHSSVAKALRILGFFPNQIRCIPTDENFRMRVDKLAKTITADRGAGLIPFVVIASCGTTNTGSVDPLREISTICRREGVWMHVDGAYGASAALSATRTSAVGGIEHADSVSWDGHKWLFQTYGCGLVLVRDKRHLPESFATDAEYLRDAAEEGGEDVVPNFWNYGIELTRPARAMKLWFTLRVLGVEKVGEMIDHGFVLAERAEEELRRLHGWEITSSASLAIMTFRFAPPGKEEDELDLLNSSISSRLLERNLAGILTTKIDGKVVLRICSIHPELSEKDMVNLVSTMDQIAHEILSAY